MTENQFDKQEVVDEVAQLERLRNLESELRLELADLRVR